MADLAIELLGNPQKLQAQQQKLIALVESLDKPGASAAVAALALRMMDGQPLSAAKT